MTNDPFFEREAKKYGSPIASRELILEVVSQHKTPVSYEELIECLKLNEVEHKEALRRRLRAMERDGQLVFTRRKCYALPERLDLIKGTVIGHREGYGFLRVDGSKSDYFLSVETMKEVIQGDVVLAQPQEMDKRGRQEARIVRIVEAKMGQFVGRYFCDAGVEFVVPDDSRYSFDIFITNNEGKAQSIKLGAIVVVELTQHPSKKSKAVGEIIEVLEEHSGANLAIEIAIRTQKLSYVWPKEVEQQTSKIKETIPNSEIKNRVDLRHLPLVTIDGEDARDFDDAVYCESKLGDGWRLWVAIADVSHYVRPGTALDTEARLRSFSAYFPTRVIPMLPEFLSNGLCSLNPQVDRLCMVCEMTISKQGRLSGYKFYNAVMNSHARFTYTKVARVLAGEEKLTAEQQPLLSNLEHLYALFQARDVERAARGAMVFETEEAKFIFNTEGRIERVDSMVRNDAHKIIEECMILANIAAARYVEKNKEPALYRVHDSPSADQVKSLRAVLTEISLTLGGGKTPVTKDYMKLTNDIAARPDKGMLQTMILRSMKPAIYDPENRGHFGLALTSYAHFTSPIRRYPDLTLHRAIKYLLNKKNEKETSRPTDGSYHYEMKEMLELSGQCLVAERKSDEAMRYVVDWLKCDYMQGHIGDKFTGIISGVNGFGFFVRLDDLFIDGLVHVTSLSNDYYRFDSVGQRLIGESSGQVYRLGDTVEVLVNSVHLEERKIDFSLVSIARKIRGAGKSAKSMDKKRKRTSKPPFKSKTRAMKPEKSKTDSSNKKRRAKKKS